MSRKLKYSKEEDEQGAEAEAKMSVKTMNGR